VLSALHELLLLLLFLVDAGGALEGGAGLDDDGGGDLFGRGSVGGADGDGDAEFAVGSAFVNAEGGRDIGVVASDSDADVTVGADQDRQTRC
jgi:hypothetical protein